MTVCGMNVKTLKLLFSPSMFFRFALLFFSLIFIVSCGEVEQTELETWMQEQRKLTPSTIPAVTAPKPFVPIPYESFLADDPFDELKLKRVLERLRGSASANVNKPDLSRKKEALEAYPLDGIKMVGFMVQKNKPTAILSASGTLFNVVVGNYLGQDFGKVTTITEQEILFKEIVQDGSGEWVKRDGKLPLTLAISEQVVGSKK
jgi:type IV pilus assembly protein PilP